MPPLADIEFDEANIPNSRQFSDTYFSKSGGLEECRTVFLGACGLPDNWETKANYVIAELGFGSGLNFLTTWEMWNKSRAEGKLRQNSVLHFISFELYPLSAAQAAKTHASFAQIGDLSKILLANWPKRAYGVQRIWLSADVALTIHIGAVKDTLPSADFKADAWFLDGFAPNKNPQMWEFETFKQIHRLSRPTVRIGTYSVASGVRAAMEQAGFQVRKCDGFGQKRWRLEAYIENETPIKRAPQPKKTVLIIGNGVAGACAANALLRRGFNVSIVDNDPSGSFKASNNPIALIMPRLDNSNGPIARFYRCAYLYCIGQYSQYGNEFVKTTIKEFPKHARDSKKFAAILKNPHFDEQTLGGIDGCLLHFDAGFAYPDRLLAKFTKAAKIINAEAAKIARAKSRVWTAYDAAGNEIAGADICIIACGAGLKAFANLPPKSIAGRAGTISICENIIQVAQPFGGKSYCLKYKDGIVFGASFIPCELDAKPIPTQEEAMENLANLAATAPQVAQNIDCQQLKGRTSVRVVTDDFIPLIGALAHEGPDLYLIGGLGSRGFSTAPIAGEIIACQINDEPMPIEADLLTIIDPIRFMRRNS